MADGTLASTTEIAPALDPRPYLQRPRVVGPILLAFPLVTLPLVAVTLLASSPAVQTTAIVFSWLFGITHFVITFSLYLNSKNLEHFASTNENKAIYFGVPALVFMYFGTIW